MKKLSKGFLESKDQAIGDLEEARASVGSAMDRYNKFVLEHAKEYQEIVSQALAAFEQYNEALEDLTGLYEEAASNARAYLDGRSEKWQESDEGRAYAEWVDQLESVSFGETIDEDDFPELDEREWPDMPSPTEDIEFPDEMPESVE